jgi:hypothetical protein
MADQKISELTLPLSVVQRLIKDALPPNAIAKNEAKLGVSKAASVFILFLTSGELKTVRALREVSRFYIFQLPLTSPQAKIKKQ